jgi:hypothetical protein
LLLFWLEADDTLRMQMLFAFDPLLPQLLQRKQQRQQQAAAWHHGYSL